MDAASNRLLGFTQTLTRVQGTRTPATTNRLAKVRILKEGEAASINYLTNAQGQQVFKSEPRPDQYLPEQSQLGTGFINWLKTSFGWLYAKAQTNASLGSAYMYADGQLPSWAVLGEYDNGSASGTGRTEYIWLPTEDGSAVPMGMFRNGKFFAVHSDHLGTPRLVTDNTNKPVWQWPYSAFGNNKPPGILKPTATAAGAFTNQPVLLATQNPAATLDLRFPGQMADVETGLFYNYFRSYDAKTGRYTQSDPVGMGGGLNRFGYVGGNPLGAIDPLGLDTVVVVGGGTSSNPFGHVAIGVTGQGVYSYGTGTPLGGSLTDYLSSQAAYRDSTVYVIKTTPEQEAKILAEILKYRSTPLPDPRKDPWGAAHDTCATRTQSALEAGGVNSIFAPFTSPFPSYTGGLAARNATTTVIIPKGAPIPSNLSSFNR